MELDFDLSPKITKEFLLSKYTQETYMQYYLGVPVKKGLFCSPLRRDKRPTCSFYKSGDTLYMKDFGTGKNYNFVSVVMEKYGLNYFQALKSIAIDFGFIKGKKVLKKKIVEVPKFSESKTADIKIEFKDYTKKELEWWESFGITPKLLNKYKVFSCKTIFLNGTKYIDCKEMVFGYYGGKLDNLELWRIYFPKRTEKRFLTNWPSKKVQGYKQLPKTGKLLIITKSMKDVMCFASFGIPAIAPNSENLFISDSMLKDLKERFKNIVVFYDNDLPGISNLNKIHKQHPELLYFWIPKKFKAKDFSDFYKKYGRENTTKAIKHYCRNISL